MGQTSTQIEQEIHAQRNELGRDLHELESRVKKATDWRLQTRRNPLTMVGVAFGGGVLLAALMGRPRSLARSKKTSGAIEYLPNAATTYRKEKAWDALDKMKGALIGVAAGTVQNFLAEAIPGFREEYRKTEERSA
ncbi:MAG: hypothetical protein JWO19_5186 [Bryobacterales bacterium]|nr:hypothetical protein [Bryobacterales bacterium]